MSKYLNLTMAEIHQIFFTQIFQAYDVLIQKTNQFFFDFLLSTSQSCQKESSDDDDKDMIIDENEYNEVTKFKLKTRKKNRLYDLFKHER